MGLLRQGIMLILWAPVAGMQIGRWGFVGLRRKGIMPILGAPVAGIQECRVGAMSSKGCHGNGHALMKGRGQVVWEVDTRGGGYSEDHTIQVDLVLAQITEIGKKGYSGGSWGGLWDPLGLLVVALLRLVPRGHRVEGCLGGSGGALRGGREPSVVSGRG